MMIAWLILYFSVSAGVLFGLAGGSRIDLGKKGAPLVFALMWPTTLGIAIGRYIKNTNSGES